MGWTKLYQAKALSTYPIENFNLIKSLRNEALIYFGQILNECDYDYCSKTCLSQDIPEDIIIDAFSGLSYTYSILGLYDEFYSEDSYSCILNDQVFDDIESCILSCGSLDTLCDSELSLCKSMIDFALQFSELVLSLDSEYIFIYDVNTINANSLHILRAQIFVNLLDYESAQSEILSVDLTNTNITFNLTDIFSSSDDSYDRYLHIGFSGDNNTKNYIPMETSVIYYCDYECGQYGIESDCIDSCSWLDGECNETYSDKFIDLLSCQSECSGNCKRVK